MKSEAGGKVDCPVCAF